MCWCRILAPRCLVSNVRNFKYQIMQLQQNTLWAAFKDACLRSSIFIALWKHTKHQQAVRNLSFNVLLYKIYSQHHNRDQRRPTFTSYLYWSMTSMCLIPKKQSWSRRKTIKICVMLPLPRNKHTKLVIFAHNEHNQHCNDLQCLLRCFDCFFSFTLVDSTPCWAKPTMAWEVSQRRLFDNRSKGQLVEDMRGATQVILLIQ